MARFPTCKNCIVEAQPCARRDGVRAAIKGLGITSAKLKCPDRLPLYFPGQRVTVTWMVTEDGYWERDATLESWPATVIQEVGSSFLIKVDDADSDNGTPASSFVKNENRYCKVRVTKLAPLSEQPQTVCTNCGRVGDAPVGEGGCYGYAGYTPRLCAGTPPAQPQQKDAA